MTDPENNQSLWNDARVESLLEDFFTKEIPLPLRGDAPVLPQPASIAVPAQLQRSRSIVGVLMVGVSAVLMVLVAAVLINPATKSPDDTASQPQGNSTDPATVSNSPAGNPTETEPIPGVMNPGIGPVESRPRIENVNQGDPGSPSEFHPWFPELEIEVFPFDPDPNSEPGSQPKPRELPESQPRKTKPKPAPVPMPEEHPQLPESRIPDPSDPDEAALDSVLPELIVPTESPLGI